VTASSADLVAALDRVGESEPLSMAVVRITSTEEELRLAKLLALALSVSPEVLVRIGQEIWPRGDYQTAVDDLRRRPYVTDTTTGIRLVEPMRGALAAEFRTEEPERSREVHGLLVRLEEEEQNDDPLDRWFVQGHVAFYLAGVDPARSVDMFGDTFAWPPIFARTPHRLWLSSLVVRQEPLLFDYAREIAFFRGFSRYIGRDLIGARSDFREVIFPARADRYDALASHLLAVILKNGREAEALHRRSIQLSVSLNMTENEVMARNSLVWAMARRARTMKDDPAGRRRVLRDALGRARENQRVARDTDDSILQVWCDRTAVSIEWDELTDFGRRFPEAARVRSSELVESLRNVSLQALDLAEIETYVFSETEAILILRDIGDTSSALAELATFVDRLRGFRYLPKAVESVAKTLEDFGKRVKLDSNQLVTLGQLKTAAASLGARIV
jgi:hypothetical protein